MLTVRRTLQSSWCLPRMRPSDSDSPDYLDELAELTLTQLLDRLTENASDLDLLVTIGRRYLRLRQLESAQRFYDRAIAIDPNDAWTHMYIGNLRYTQCDYGSAIESFQRAAELLPDDACPHWCLGDAYDALGDAILAERHYKTAVAIEPDSTDAKNNLDNYYERRRKPG